MTFLHFLGFEPRNKLRVVFDRIFFFCLLAKRKCDILDSEASMVSNSAVRVVRRQWNPAVDSPQVLDVALTKTFL